MQKASIEPGFLQVFKVYAWLRVIFTLFSLRLLNPDFARHFNWADDFAVPVIFLFLHTLLLLVILYWHKIQDLFGQWYVPFLLSSATMGLMIEQQLFSTQSFFWQLHPFLYILLILVAWQYRFLQVVVYTVLTVLVNVIFLWIWPAPESLTMFSQGTEWMFTYGLLFSRSVSFLLLGYVVTRLVDAQRQQRQALALANQKLVSHAEMVEQLTLSRERLRLSRELHDTLAHTLSAMAVQLDALTTIWQSSPQKAEQMIDQMLQTTRSGLDETRRALSALRASALEEMGLALALRTLAEDFAARNGLQLDFSCPDTLRSLAPDVEQSLYRIAQEALENIARHAKATQVRLCVEQNGAGLNLSISDNGRGFDALEKSDDDKFGMIGMRERAELLGAVLSVESQPGRGSTLNVRVGEMQ
jgi:signal transduction histidine kinase